MKVEEMPTYVLDVSVGNAHGYVSVSVKLRGHESQWMPMSRETAERLRDRLTEVLEGNR